MPSVLNSALAPNVGTTVTTVYSAPTSPPTAATVIGLIASNNTANALNCSIWLNRGSTKVSIITNGSVPVGNTLQAVGPDKLVMQPGDFLTAQTTTGTVDITVSKLEQS